MRARLVYMVAVILVGITTPLWADHAGGNIVPGRPSLRDAKAETLDFSKLSPPNSTDVNPREACGLATLVIEYLQLRSEKSAFCKPGELKTACEEIASVTAGATKFLTPNETRELHRKVPKILSTVYDCVKKISDAKLNFLFKQKEFLLEKKKDLVEAACETIGDLALSGNDANAKEKPQYPGVDFENPCRAVFQAPGSRIDACFRSGAGVCKALTGNVNLEDLVPPGIYEASWASHIPIDLPDYLKGQIDGAADVLKKKTASRLNDIVSKKLLAKGGAAATIALATITAASKQIYATIENGGNDWSECAGTGNMGVCFYNTFIRNGPPESHPFARPKIVDGEETIECCYSKLDLYADGGVFNQKFIRTDDSLKPIETGAFEKSLCHELDGTSQEKYLTQVDGMSVYFRYRDSRRVRVKGRSCVLGATKEPLYILPPPKKESRDPGPQASTMGSTSREDRAPKPIYAPGARPTDPPAPAPSERFHDLFELPPAVAKEEILPLAKLPEPKFDAFKLPDVDLRKQITRRRTEVALPQRTALKPIALPHAEPREPKLPASDLLIARNDRRAEENLPKIGPAPLTPDELPRVDAPVAQVRGNEPALPDRRLVVRPDRPNPPVATRTARPDPIKLAAVTPKLEIPLPSPEPRKDSSLDHLAGLPPITPAPDHEPAMMRTATVADPSTDNSPILPPLPKAPVTAPVSKTEKAPVYASSQSPHIAPSLPATGPEKISPPPPRETYRPPASCFCRFEWSAPRDNFIYPLCVVRNHGQVVHTVRQVVGDPTCQSACAAEWGVDTVREACQLTAPAPAAPAPTYVNPPVVYYTVPGNPNCQTYVQNNRRYTVCGRRR